MNFLDLFCGCGGLTKGMMDSGFTPVAGIDHCVPAMETYRANFDHLAICRDLTTLPPEMFCQEYFNGHKLHIDLIAAGPPCQGFSSAGRRDCNDPRNSLFMEFVKYLDYFQPSVLVMENVMGILSMKNAEGVYVIDIIKQYLEEHYHVCVSKLMTSDFEVPQNRRRVIILGFHRRLQQIPCKPSPIITRPEDRIPVSTILEPPDHLDDPKLWLTPRALEGIHRKRQRSIREGKGFGAQFLDFDKPCYTISSRYYKDGYDALVRYDEHRVRRLSVLELRRVQTFPDDFIMKGTRREQIIQIGNAVPCCFAFHIGRSILSQLS